MKRGGAEFDRLSPAEADEEQRQRTEGVEVARRVRRQTPHRPGKPVPLGVGGECMGELVHGDGADERRRHEHERERVIPKQFQHAGIVGPPSPRGETNTKRLGKE